MTYDMNWMMSGLDINSAWTWIIVLGIGYLIGSILVSRIYISWFKGGDTTYVDPQTGERKRMPRFGTSWTWRVHGMKVALPHFIWDVFKPMVGYWAIIYPLQMFVPQFETTITLFYWIGVIVGNNWPVWWKFEGGVGAALGFGMVLSLNWFLGILGFTLYIVLLKTTKQTGFAALLSGLSAFILISIPAINNADWMWWPPLENLSDVALSLTTGAMAAYSLWGIFLVMMIKRRTALKGFLKLFTKFFSGKMNETVNVDQNRFSSVDDVK